MNPSPLTDAQSESPSESALGPQSLGPQAIALQSMAVRPLSAEAMARVLRVLVSERARYLAFVRRRLRSGADAEDLLQQALLKATEKMPTLRDESRASAWFYRLLRRTIADHHAAWALAQDRLELLKVDAEEGTPEEVATCGCSLGLLEKMRAEYRDILARADIDEEPLSSIAASLGTSTNNATVRLHRARKALREDLVHLCGTQSASGCASCACD